MNYNLPTKVPAAKVSAVALRVDPQSTVDIQPGSNGVGNYIESSSIGDKVVIDSITRTLIEIENEVSVSGWTREP